MNDDMNTPRSALDAGIAAAALTNPHIRIQDGRQYLLIPDEFTAKDITDPHRLPDHIRQSITFDDRDSLTLYANRFSSPRTLILADYDAGKIAARLDWHNTNDAPDASDASFRLKPEQNLHIATLRLRDSEEYARWAKMENQLWSQAEFAQFIEENVADVTHPEQTVLLEICRDLETSQGVNFKSGTRLDNGDRTFKYETETHVKGEIQVPTEIHLSIPLYHGESPTDVKAKFRYQATPSGLMLGFRWHRVEYRRQATFREMAFRIAEETGLPVMFGRPT